MAHTQYQKLSDQFNVNQLLYLHFQMHSTLTLVNNVKVRSARSFTKVNETWYMVKLLSAIEMS